MLELNYSERSIKNQMQMMKHEFIIGFNKERPVGFTSVERNFMNKKQLMIHKLYMLPTFQGKGFGKKFIGYISKLAQDSENNSLCLKVFHKNTNGISFYKTIGFSIIGDHKTILENGYEVLDYVMTKNISKRGEMILD
jgi:ribosomal protein S18 acetylase RimI-like enzyme